MHTWLKKKNRKKFTGWIVLVVGLGLLLAGLTGLTIDASYSDPTYPTVDIRTATEAPKNVALPIGIVIPSRHVNLPVSLGSVRGGNAWSISRTGVSYLDISARPGSDGNIVLYGHNWKGLLHDVLDVEMGEVIDITTDDDKLHRYTVAEVFDITPNDVSILQPTEKETLTLYTCSGLFNQTRRVIRAYKLGSPSQLQ